MYKSFKTKDSTFLLFKEIYNLIKLKDVHVKVWLEQNMIKIFKKRNSLIDTRVYQNIHETLMLV